VAGAVATPEVRGGASATSYGDLATVGPSVTVTVPASGRVLISVTSGMKGATGSTVCYMSFAGSAPNAAITADDSRALILTSNDLQQSTASFVLSGLTAGSTTFTAKYKASTTNATACTFSNRSIWAIPLS
jgi:hypothetical protein